MTVRKRLLLIGAVSLLAAATGSGADAYLFRFDTSSSGGGCGSFYWFDELIFHNNSSTDATVRLVGVSNGQAVSPQPLLLAAGTTRSSLVPGPEFLTWVPTSHPIAWVAKLDVPDGVILTSRALVNHFTPCPCGKFQPCVFTYAGLDLPVSRALTPPGTPSYFMGADVGGLGIFPSPDSRTNILVFNGGSSPAAAVVELRNAADDTVAASQTLEIAPNTVVQASVSGSGFATGGQAASFERYVVVTVDQPSLSTVVSLANDRPPFFPASVAR